MVLKDRPKVAGGGGIKILPCRGGETGRHAWFRAMSWQQGGSSTLPRGISHLVGFYPDFTCPVFITGTSGRVPPPAPAENTKIPTPKELGIPSGSYNPMKNIETLGQAVRGMKNETPKRSIIFRLTSIIVAFIFFILPSTTIFIVFAYNKQLNFSSLYPIFFNSIYFLAGILIIVANLKKS